jgi:hypothetical protein
METGPEIRSDILEAATQQSVAGRRREPGPETIARELETLAEALPLLIADDAPGFMTKVALILKPAPPKAPPLEEEKK